MSSTSTSSTSRDAPVDTSRRSPHDYLGNVRALVLEEIERLLPRDRKSSDLNNRMRDYPLRHGKALRPAICLAACQANGGFLHDAIPTAAVFELYHNAFLIHDDVEDGSEKRRHEPTLHVKYGIPIAVNVGDALLAAAMQPLLDNTARIGLGRALRIHLLVTQMARESAEGQMLELAWVTGQQAPRPRDYARMVYKKTCWYSFIAPALAGAIIAGVDKAELRIWRGAMTLIGISFQIADDYLNLYGDDRVGKESDGDLWEGKYSLMLLIALERATPAEREKTLAILRRKRPHPSTEILRVLKYLDAEVGADRASNQIRDKVFDLLMSNNKSDDDVEWLRDLLDRYDAGSAAMQVATRFARFGHDRFKEILLPESIHQKFLDELFNYVLDRKL